MLDREQEELLSRLVEQARSVPRAQLEDFFLVGIANLIHGPNTWTLQVGPQTANDLELLASEGLIRFSIRGKGVDHFFVTPTGYRYDQELKRAAGEPVAVVEQEIRRYLDADTFRSRYPEAYARWSEATDLLWGADSERELTTIGHKTREAVQTFATTLLERHQITDADPDV